MLPAATSAATWTRRSGSARQGQRPCRRATSLCWSGQYESIQRVRERLKLVLPITLLLVFLLLYLNTGSVVKTDDHLAGGSVLRHGRHLAAHLLGYNMSIAVWVGLIALMGVDAETGVFMLLYLDLSYAEAAARGQLSTWPQLPRCDRARRGQTSAPEGHDRRLHALRTAAHHVVQRRRS